MHCANSQKHRDRLRKPVECNFCDRVFNSPSALAQHMESGFHNVHRHQVTQAVRSLRVIPTITLPVDNYIQGHISGAHIEAVGEEYGYGPQHQSANIRGDEPVSESSDEEDADDIQAPQVGLPVGQFVEPGPPLRDEELAHSTVMTGPPRATAIVSRPVVPPLAGSSYTTYVPADFLDLGIPYSCHLCLRTFRTILALTMHLNSAVHDPDAFICPGPKCKATFTLVSGLMQHLESGKCGLSSKQEVFERFEKLTGRFSKLLKI
ncbi:hypothetical protein CC2G_001553 [Coprinopsis cinerea AmutBmut pab1-1]|nr:hypothetical protein CC2G_001553 [Coprinopsis cinerea AmutBmut pab1-1]